MLQGGIDLGRTFWNDPPVPVRRRGRPTLLGTSPPFGGLPAGRRGWPAWRRIELPLSTRTRGYAHEPCRSEQSDQYGAIIPIGAKVVYATRRGR